MSVDGPERSDPPTPSPSAGLSVQQSGYLGGSRALDTLDKFITSTESFFHPSNSGPWTVIVRGLGSRNVIHFQLRLRPQLTNLLQCLANEFIKRWQQEEQRDCKTPVVGHNCYDGIQILSVVTTRLTV